MRVVNKYKHTVTQETIYTTVYIGRGSKWGNPFVIGKDGNRDDVCNKHAVWFKDQIAKGVITKADLLSLVGKDLMCFCAPLRCHGDTIIEQVLSIKD